MKPITELPDDPALPAFAAIRGAGLAGAIPALGLDDGPVELLPRRYHPGRRAVLEARVGQRHFAVKVCAEDPEPEAQVHQALAAAGLAGDSGERVPPLLAWDHDLQVLVLGWLEGPSAGELIQAGQGERAGQVAARWFQCAASLPVKLGSPLGAAHMLKRTREWAAVLGEADAALGTAATRSVERLARTQPVEGAPHLVHGGLYAKHVLDLGDGSGAIDWGRFGQGPLELDAGIFLASIWRFVLRHDAPAGEVARAEQALLAGTSRLLDQRAVSWHRAAELLRFAKREVTRGHEDKLARARALVGEAERLAAEAG